MMNEVKIKELGDLMGISMVGTIMSRIQLKDPDLVPDDEKETGRVLVPKAISNGCVNQKEVSEYIIKKGSGKGKVTIADDVVIKLTTPYECARITMEDEDLIVPSYCMILREIDTSEVDLDYLVGYLNTGYARQLFSAGVAAATNSMLKMKDALQIKVPLLPMEEQKLLGRLYKLSSEKQMLLKEMLENETQVAENLITSAIREVMRDA